MSQWQEIFGVGEWTDMKGRVKNWTEADLRSIVDNYGRRPANGDAPLVIGHPKMDSPAYGWVEELKIESGKLLARLGSLSDGVVDLIRKKAYRHISIAVVGGGEEGFRLRHVGLLGAMPPAVSGLAPISLAEDEAERTVIEYAAAEDEAIGLLKKLASFFGLDLREKSEFADPVPDPIPLADVETDWVWSWGADADAIIERYGWSGLAAVTAFVDREHPTEKHEENLPAVKAAYKLPFARIIDGRLQIVWRGAAAGMGALLGARGGVDMPAEAKTEAYNELKAIYGRFDKEPPESNFNQKNEEISKMTEEEKQKKAAETAAAAEPGSGEEEKRDFASAERVDELEKELAVERRERKREQIARRIEKIGDEGKLTPAMTVGLAEFALAISESGEEFTFSTGDGDKKLEVKADPADFLFGFLEKLPDLRLTDPLAGADSDPGAADGAASFAVKDGEEADQGRLALHAKAQALAAERKIPYEEAAVLAEQGIEPAGGATS